MSKQVRVLTLAALVCLFVGTNYSDASAGSDQASTPAPFQDPLELPAQPYAHLNTRPLLGAAHAGARLVAVGMRGLIIVSDDSGKTWTQAKVPVQTDLLSVQFPTAEEGWAVGHNGVILHSQDGGLSWSKQLDGIAAGQVFEKYYQARADAGDATAQRLLTSIKLDFQDGPTLPFLDVWFENPKKGFVVGSFGLIAVTEDGGQHWIPALDRVENTELFNLNSVTRTATGLFIAGEHGMVYKFDEAANTFRRLQTGYNGSLFGVIGSTKALLAFGLRGTIFRSTDSGTTWQGVESGTSATITGGAYNEETKTFTLVTEAGEAILGDESASRLHVLPVAGGGILTNVVPMDSDARLLVGVSGARVWSGS